MDTLHPLEGNVEGPKPPPPPPGGCPFCPFCPFRPFYTYPIEPMGRGTLTKLDEGVQFGKGARKCTHAIPPRGGGVRYAHSTHSAHSAHFILGVNKMGSIHIYLSRWANLASSHESSTCIAGAFPTLLPSGVGDGLLKTVIICPTLVSITDRRYDIHRPHRGSI